MARKKNRKGKAVVGKRKTRKPAPACASAHELVSLYRQGRLREAVGAARDFVQRWPDQATAWNVLGVAGEGLGELETALEGYDRALRLEPSNAVAHNNRGNVLRALGRSREALEAFGAAIARRHGFAEAHHNRGLALADVGRYSEAIADYERALELAPNLIDGYINLGNALLEIGRLEEAERAYRQALERSPRYAQVWSNLGNVLTSLYRFEAALEAHDRAIQYRPDSARVRQNRGLTLQKICELAEAEEEFRRALEMSPEDTDVRLNLAQVLKDRQGFEEAEQIYRGLIRQDPDRAQYHIDLAHMLADLGRSGEALDEYRAALAVAPDHGSAIYSLAMIKRFSGEHDPDWTLVSRALERCDPERDPAHSAYVHYAVAKALDDSDRAPADVFAYYRSAAQLRRRTFDYDVSIDEAAFTRIASVCTRERIAQVTPGVVPPVTPIFIIGMPRSGTTLIEQILASHPAVDALGERQELMRLIARETERRGTDMAGVMDAALAGECGDLESAYRRMVTEPAQGAFPAVTDKLPANFKALGLIYSLMPYARVIHARREPADTCVSCFTTLFAEGQWFSYDLEELGRYYRAYDRLMAHWRDVLPAGWLLDVQYEDLVDSPEEQTRRLLEHCGLDWAPECLEFHRTERRVATASSQQVRSPLYRSAVARWRRFEHQLEPLFRGLGPLAPSKA